MYVAWLLLVWLSSSTYGHWSQSIFLLQLFVIKWKLSYSVVVVLIGYMSWYVASSTCDVVTLHLHRLQGRILSCQRTMCG